MNECKLLMEENINKDRRLSIVIEPECEMVNKKDVLLNTPNGKIITTSLNDETNNKINLLFNEKKYVCKSIWDYIPWLNKKIDQQQIFNDSLKKSLKFINGFDINNIPLEIGDNFIINLAQEYLTKNGFNVKKEGIIEYWSFVVDNDENNPIFFDVYKNDELFDFNVETCIFFTQNDLGINGNYDYYKIEHTSPLFSTTNNKNILTKPNELKTNVTRKEIKISSNLVVLISGNQLYGPQPLYGQGKRNYVVVKLRSNRLN